MKADPLFHFRRAGLEDRYKKRGEEAKRGIASAAIVLKCIECSGLEFNVAKDCATTTCPLFPMNERFIKRKSAQKHAAAERRQKREH
jgi:hypothetical protein